MADPLSELSKCHERALESKKGVLDFSAMGDGEATAAPKSVGADF